MVLDSLYVRIYLMRLMQQKCQQIIELLSILKMGIHTTTLLIGG